MAGVIKSKGNEIFTTGVRRINTDTGSSFVTEALQRANARIADATYSQAVSREKELGRQTAINTPIKREDGRIVFEDITEDMSRVARNAARPIIEQNYAREYKIDADRVLIEERTKSKSAEEFKQKSTIALQGLLDAVPDEFQGVARNVIQQAAALSQNQHYSAMLLDEARQQEAQRIENLQLDYLDQTEMVQALVRSGEIDTAIAMHDAILDDLNETGVENGLTDTNIRRIKNDLSKAYMGTLVRSEAERLLREGNFQAVEGLILALETGSVNKDIPASALNQDDMDDFNENKRIRLSPLISQEQLDSIENDPTRIEIASAVRRIRTEFKDNMAMQAQLVAAQNAGMQAALGNHVATGMKAEQNLDLFFQSQGIAPDPQSWMSDRTRAQLQENQMAADALANGNILPGSLSGLMDQVANAAIIPEANELQNLVVLFNNATKGMAAEGEVFRPKNLKEDTFQFFNAVSIYGNTYGFERMADGSNFLTADPRRLGELKNNVQIIFKNPNKSAEQLIKEHLFAESGKRTFGNLGGRSERMVPGTVQRLMPIALRAYGSLPRDKADEVVSNAYKAIYTKTKFIRSPDAIEFGRHEFSPEAFYGGASNTMRIFQNHVNNKIERRLDMPGMRIGRDYFLWPSSKSTNRKIVWNVIGEDGGYVQDTQGQLISISSQEINKLPAMETAFTKARKLKINRARRVRENMIEMQNQEAMYP